MILQHNLQAMNAQRMYNLVTSNKAKATERLSSGYRINRAADDAAGLTISEKMRYQIRGLNQASENIQDGISLIQVAEGALAESHSILQRMNELATQAANDTNTSVDRDAIQAELNQLKIELDRVSDTTTFNSDIYPLKATPAFPEELQNRPLTITNVGSGNITCDGKVYAPGDTFTINPLSIPNNFNTFYDICQSGAGSSSLGRFAAVSSQPYEISPTTDITLDYSTTDDLKYDEEGRIYFMGPSGSSYSNDVTYAINRHDWLDIEYPHFSNLAGANTTLDNLKPLTVELSTTNLNLQVGSVAYQKITIPTVDASAKAMGITDIDVSSYKTAGATMSMVQNAIETVSAWRSDYGARQNRLEHTYNNVTNTEENTQAAESRIRDTDMAKEMVSLSTANILASAGESMMAQANQSVSSVLSLLQ